MVIVVKRSLWSTRFRLSYSKFLFIYESYSETAGPFISTPVTILSNTTYNYASRYHLIPSGGADLEANHSQPGSARAEAERRRFVFLSPSQNVDIHLGFFRAMALKALDQRLANPASTSSPAQSSHPQPSATPPKPETKTPDESDGGDLGTGGRASH